MDISNNTNISTQIAKSISKLNLNTAKRSTEIQKPKENTPDALLHSVKKDDIDIRVENTRLKEENEILKQKMDAILTYIKEHKIEG